MNEYRTVVNLGWLFLIPSGIILLTNLVENPMYWGLGFAFALASSSCFILSLFIRNKRYSQKVENTSSKQ